MIATTKGGRVFASEAGALLDRRYVTTHRFKPLLKRAGLPGRAGYERLQRQILSMTEAA